MFLFTKLVVLGFISLLYGCYNLVVAEHCDIKTICERTDNITDLVLDECQETRKFDVKGRCCYYNDSIVGIDFNDCQITSVAGKLTDYPNLIVLGLEGNPTFNCTNENEFVGLKKLDFLVLPSHCHNCPGSWHNTSEASNSTICDGLIDECVQLNITCPEFAMCVSNGPGIATCDCKPGHYGYKCLREGTFPMVPFIVGLLVPTLVVSFCVWITQRRLVKKNN